VHCSVLPYRIFDTRTFLITLWPSGIIPGGSVLQYHIFDITQWFQCVEVPHIRHVCCSVLQCVAACCSALQCVAVCCSVLQCAAVCCSVLQFVAVCCSVLLCVAVCYSVLQCVAVPHIRHEKINNCLSAASDNFRRRKSQVGRALNLQLNKIGQTREWCGQPNEFVICRPQLAQLWCRMSDYMGQLCRMSECICQTREWCGQPNELVIWRLQLA